LMEMQVFVLVARGLLDAGFQAGRPIRGAFSYAYDEMDHGLAPSGLEESGAWPRIECS